MYISINNCKTQGLRQAYINSMNVNRRPSLKHLNQIDKNLSRTYTQTRFYGGSLKSLWNKIKKFGKHVLNSAIRTTRQMFKPVKWIIHQVSTNDSLKAIIAKAADAVGATFGVPGLGKIITTGITAADNISDAVENIVKAILDKKPSATPNEIRKIIDETKNVIINLTPEDKKKDVESKLKNISVNKMIEKLGEKFNVKDLPKIVNSASNKADELIKKIQAANPNLQLKEIEELVNMIKNITTEVPPENAGTLKTVYSNLPKLIQSVGYAKAKAAAGYLPYIDPSTLTKEDRTGKGGRALKPKFKVTKPKVITSNKSKFDKLPAYKADTVADCAGRIFMNGGEILSPEHLARHEAQLSGRVGLGDKNITNGTSDILARLRKRAAN